MLSKKLALSLLAIIFFVVASWKFLMIPLFDSVPLINETIKTCLVTGASSGIGLEIAREMINKGWKVIGIARREKKLRNLATLLGPAFIPYVCNVSNRSQVSDVSIKIKKQTLKPTLFFLNAGTGIEEPKFQPFSQKHKIMFDTNYFGAIAWVEEWLAEVKKYGGGTFVATSSVASLFAVPGSAGYSASKAAINSCFQSFRLQYRNDNIGFVTVLPGPVDTSMLKTDKTLPFTHKPAKEAKYIVEQLFKRKKQIEPSWFYSCVLRFFNWMPDAASIYLLQA